jgi:hypothetical protein
VVNVNKQFFPRLGVADFTETSPDAEDYNCIAWAAGVQGEWWEPSIDGVWPIDVPRNPTVDNLSAKLGYSECDSADLEEGFEKVAIYGSPSEYEHAARQLPDGRWTSKLGADVDISHVNLDCLEGGLYGDVQRILKRPVA